MKIFNNLSPKRKKGLLIVGIAILLTLSLAISYAFYGALISDVVKTFLNIESDSLDDLSFNNGDGLHISPGSHNLGMGMENISDSTTASATLIANNTNNKASQKYDVYFIINHNNYEYSSGIEKTPEIILTIHDPDGNLVTSLPGLNYIDTDEIQGFDITSYSGSMKVADSFIINDDNSINGTTQNWVFTITMLNLPIDQNINSAKTLSGKVILQQGELPDINIVGGNTFTVGVNNKIICNNGDYYWDNMYNKLYVSDFTAYTECSNVESNVTEIELLNNHIISLSGQGEVFDELGYRYEGISVNNFVWFNEELWRIIGVFDATLSDGSVEKLTKIVKKDSIGSFSWDTSEINDVSYGLSDWSNSDIKEVLNGPYLNSLNGNDLDICFGRMGISLSCDYSNSGIGLPYTQYIENVIWNIGATLHLSDDVNYAYEVERGNESIDGRDTTWTGHIGLIYPSDYGFSVKSSSCDRYTNMSYYNTTECAGNSYLFSSNLIWTMTPALHINNAWHIESGTMDNDITASGKHVFPTLYLKSDISLLGGTGSEDNPYRIGYN